MDMERLKRAGYKVIVRYQTHHKEYGWLDCHFPTTNDAVKLHTAALEKNPKVRQIKLEAIA